MYIKIFIFYYDYSVKFLSTEYLKNAYNYVNSKVYWQKRLYTIFSSKNYHKLMFKVKYIKVITNKMKINQKTVYDVALIKVCITVYRKSRKILLGEGPILSKNTCRPQLFEIIVVINKNNILCN